MRKIASHPSIIPLPPRAEVAPFFDISFSLVLHPSCIFALRVSVFYVPLFRFFSRSPTSSALPLAANADARRRRRVDAPLFPIRKSWERSWKAFPDTG